MRADITDGNAIKPAFHGVHTVLHLAAANQEHEVNSWDATMRGTVQGTLNVYEAAREATVRRVIHMSSGCTQLAYEWDDNLPYGTLANGPDDQIPESWEMVDLDWPVRPDSPYAVGKLLGELVGRYYADKYGISTLVIRLGAVLPDDRPQIRRHYPGYLSQAACVQMIDCCLDAPDGLHGAVSSLRHAQKKTGFMPVEPRARMPVVVSPLAGADAPVGVRTYYEADNPRGAPSPRYLKQVIHYPPVGGSKINSPGDRPGRLSLASRLSPLLIYTYRRALWFTKDQWVANHPTGSKTGEAMERLKTSRVDGTRVAVLLCRMRIPVYAARG